MQNRIFQLTVSLPHNETGTGLAFRAGRQGNFVVVNTSTAHYF